MGCSLHRQSPQLFRYLVTYTTFRAPAIIAKGFPTHSAVKELDGTHPLHNFFDRSGIKQGLQMILSGCEEIKAALPSVSSREGTRGKTPSELSSANFHNGSFKMATKTGCPIIPLSISPVPKYSGSTLSEDRGTHVTVTCGKPIIPASLREEKRKKRLKLYEKTFCWNSRKRKSGKIKSMTGLKCLKTISAAASPLCGIFCPHSVAVARYAALIRTKISHKVGLAACESFFREL